MNQLLSKQITSILGDLSQYDPRVISFINEVDKSYSAQFTNTASQDDIHSNEVFNELQQRVKENELVIEGLKRAIVALEPGSNILNGERSGLDEATYLSESLNKLIDAHKQASDNLEIEKKKLESVNKMLQIEKDRLAAEKAKDQAVLYAIADGLIVTNTEGQIIMVNNAFETLLGWGIIESIGKRMYEIIKKEDRFGNPVIEEERLHKKAILTGQKFESSPEKTEYYLKKDGTKFPVSVSVAPIIVEGKIIGAVEVFKDITKEKEIDKAKNEFVSLASHQLRTPLSSINWYTEMLMEGDLRENIKENQTYLGEIGKAAERMKDMINALLDVSRLELGTFAIEPEMTNVIDLIKKVINEIQPKIMEKRHRISGNINPNIPIIKSDPKLLSMVFQNLVSNAVKYTKNDGIIQIVVNLTADNNYIIFSIQDNGHGIPDKDKENIFKKLYRASNIKKIDTDGNGLGLYIVKSIMETLGGAVWFKSEEDKGSIFYVAIPTKSNLQKSGNKQLT